MGWQNGETTHGEGGDVELCDDAHASDWTVSALIVFVELEFISVCRSDSTLTRVEDSSVIPISPCSRAIIRELTMEDREGMRDPKRKEYRGVEDGMRKGSGIDRESELDTQQDVGTSEGEITELNPE